MSEPNASAVDVAVIGAGVVGLSVAWRALARGLSVTVLERDAAGQGTSRLAAGMIAPVTEAAPAEAPLLELGLASTRLYPDFIRELEAASGHQVGYTRCGTLLVARDDDEAEALERELAVREAFGLQVQRLRPTAARRLEPGLAPVLRLALSVPGDHAVDPRRLAPALVAAVRRNGGEVRECTAASGLALAGGRVSGVRLSDGSELAAGAVVISAGVWSGDLAGLEDQVALRPIKGQIMRLHDPTGPGMLSRVIRMAGVYIVPRGDGHYVIGATTEERGFDTTVTAGAALALLRDASELVPGVSELVLDEFAAGLRPGTSDNLPAIGPGARPGLHWAVGHGRSGILLAPVTAELVVSAVLGQALPASARPFAVDRFAMAGSAA